jgi:hypothetical protein
MTFVCACANLERASAECRQPDPEVVYRVEPGDWPLQLEVVRDAARRGAAIWHGASSLRFREAVAGESPDVVLRPCRIDGPGSVLAWSELPCPWQPPVSQCYDVRERWSAGPEPESGAIWLPLVVAHELGHAIGIGHGPSGNVMAPTYSAMTRQLGPWDIQEVQSRYGAAPKPEPPKEPPMNKILACLLEVLPQFLQCIFRSQAESVARGEPGPLEELVALIAAARRRSQGDHGQTPQG